MKDKIQIETNIFKVFLISYKSLFKNMNFIFWLISLMMIIEPFCFKSNIILETFNLRIFLAPGITGLSFTLALITATTRIFDAESLAKIFLADENEFYDLMAAYFLTGLLWVLVSLLALLDSFMGISTNIMRIVMLALVSGSILGLWNLLYGHLQDTMFSIRVPIEKWKKELEEESRE